MIVILKQNAKREEVEKFTKQIEAKGIKVSPMVGEHTTILGFLGDTTRLDMDDIMAVDIVESVRRVQEPFKNANRKFHPQDTIVKVGEKGIPIGDGRLAIFAGPCSVESEEQIVRVAKEVKRLGATVLRGGAFKPRTSPYAFQGMQADGITLLLEAKKETGLPIVSELMSIRHLDLFADIDIIQIGARNMQNFELLKEVGRCDKPILLKRGLANTMEELLMSAEYIMAEGNQNVILCERGIRTFETYTRNTLDITAVPVIKKLSHLPIVVDPSHASGQSWLVEPLSKAAAVIGADGLIIEVHNDPKHALCDGAQSLDFGQFEHVMGGLKQLREIV